MQKHQRLNTILWLVSPWGAVLYQDTYVLTYCTQHTRYLHIVSTYGVLVGLAAALLGQVTRHVTPVVEVLVCRGT